MKYEFGLFRTRVGLRIFLLFMACAVVPIGAFAWIAFSQTSKQIHEQSRNRLAQDSKALALAIYDRLMLLSAEMKIVASSLNIERERLAPDPSVLLAEKLRERFVGIAILTQAHERVLLLGGEDIPWELSRADREHIFANKTLLRHDLRPNVPPAVYLYALVDPEWPEHGVVMAEVNGAYLWQVADGKPAGTEFAVLDRQRNTVFASVSDGLSMDGVTPDSLGSGHAGFLEGRVAGVTYWAAYRSVLLEPNFAQEWYVLLGQSRDDALAPLADFGRAFPLIIVLSLCAVLLLSYTLIKWSMVPIEVLTDATRRVAQGSLGHTVAIRSGDEFERLGESFNDMSRRLKEGQTLLERASKMSTMGEMAAGIIHEVKQPLTAISGLLQLSLLVEQPPRQRKNLETALGAADRLNRILERFRSFCRKSEERMEPLSLGHVIAEVHALMEHELRQQAIRYTIHADDDLPLISGDEQALHQVFSNLVRNAAQAMDTTQPDRRALDITLASLGGKVLVEIKDTGCGMSDDVKARIFDPFFTTKDRDKGTGLGLAIVASILHRHGATIEVESRVGVGTTFTLTFLAIPEDPSPTHGA